MALRSSLRTMAAPLALALFLAACPGDEGGTGPKPRTPTSLGLTPTAPAVDEGATLQITATVYDQDGEPFTSPPAGFSVAWSSSATDVATVSGSGMVTGNVPGTARVTAQAGALSAGADVTVRAVGGTVAGTVTLANDFAVVFARGSRPAPRGGMGALGAKHGPLRAPAASRTGAAPVMSHTPHTLVVIYRSGALVTPAGAREALRSRTAAAEAGSRMRARLATRLGGGAKVAAVAPGLHAARVKVDDPARIEEVRARLAADPSVLRVEREPLLQPTAAAGGTVPNDPFFAAQAWHYAMIDLPRAWRITTGSPQVVVAVVDDGTRFGHPDLASVLTTDGYDFVSDGYSFPVCGGGGVVDLSLDGDGYDPDPTTPAVYGTGFGCLFPQTTGGHGTHVAGTVGGAGNEGVGGTGVAWSVRVRPVRVLGSAGGTSWDIAMGIAYAAGYAVEVQPGSFVQAPSRAGVINLSLGGPGGEALLCPAVTAATQAGSLVVAAAGNDESHLPQYPAACPDALSVSAVNPDFDRASYSSWGATVDLSAPGGELDWGSSFGVLSSLWDFAANQPLAGFYQGTSMAAPHVSGVAALLLSREPGLTPAQLRARLTTYAVDLGEPGWDHLFGAGLVNARNALTQTHSAPRASHARLYDAATGAVVAQGPAAGGQLRFTRVPAGSYLVMAGEDEGGDGLFGVPGAGLPPRRWGGHTGGGSALAPVTVTVGATSAAPVTIGFPFEAEPNDLPATARRLAVGGYVIGQRGSETDVDYYQVTVPGGTYTFETAGYLGGCGFAFEVDTEVAVFRLDGVQMAVNDDINAAGLNFCSRVTLPLAAGTYTVGVRGAAPGLGRYVLQARTGA